MLRSVVMSAVCLLTGLLSSSARATPTWIPPAPAALIEVAYMPGVLRFTMSTGDATCPAGTPLHYSNANAENVKAALSVVLASRLSGQPLYVVYESTEANSPSLCTIRYIGMNPPK